MKAALSSRMAGTVNGKIPAASTRSHTSKSQQNSSLFSGMLKKLLLVGFVGLLAYAYQAITPPSPKICGLPNGPPITAPRIKLSDGRHLAYKEYGVPKEKAKYKFIYVHGFDSYRNHASVTESLSPEVAESLGIYIVSYDRPGYGESDPNPKRTLKSMALDVEELADKLGLGDKFYLIGFSMGGQLAWTCLKYIPHRLAGVTLIAPVVNYWWSCFPANVSAEAYNKQFPEDQWALRVAHHFPWLIYWWDTQKLFPGLTVSSHSPKIMSPPDQKLVSEFQGKISTAPVRQQGEFESIHRDLIVGFGKWELDPTELTNPFPNNEGTVHLWQGDDDLLVPVTLQRYIAEKLPWIRYHELPDTGHMFPYARGMGETIIRTQLSMEN